MTCEEFERVVPELESNYTLEQEEHLKACPSCSSLMLDLNALAREARLLQASDEPSPRVWNAIEIALRAEGLIREADPAETAQPWRLRLSWMVPVLAAALIAAGVLLHKRSVDQRQVAVVSAPSVQPATAQTSRAADDEQLLRLVEARTPALRGTFESDLKRVNAYIQDAELSLRNNPNDEIAQQYLMSAYDQRAMVYEIALQRAVP